MNELALFAGAGGGILGGHLLGWRTVCGVECDAYSAQVLAQRQNDRILKPFPIWSDVRSFDGKPWQGIVDVVSGGFPCQDISSAGKGAGISGSRSGLWSQMARIVGEVRPCYVFVENSPLLVKRGLAVVISDLAQMGYVSRWGMCLGGELFRPLITGLTTNAKGSGLSLPTPSGVNRGSSHVMGRMDEWGGSGNPLRGTEIGKWRCASFEEWMMGWPTGWSALTPLEMDRFQSWQLQHSQSFQG